MKKTTKSADGTSYHLHTVTASVKQLKSILGEPWFNDNDGKDKVNFEWVLEAETGDVFTVYDWKNYRTIDENEQIKWHLGAHSEIVTMIAKDEIEAVLNKVN